MMRTVNLSFPEKLIVKIDKEIEEHGYASRSEFFRALVRMVLVEPEVIISPQPKKAKKLVFEKPSMKPLSEIRKKFEKTGLYNKKFIDSLIAGIAKSSLYANTASKKRS